MYFKRINDTTINCVITPEDLQNNGIRIDDLFERKKEAMDYLKTVIKEAAREENFNLAGDYTSMRITVLPDHSISLTLSENKNRIRVNDLRQADAGNTGNVSAFPEPTKAAGNTAAPAGTTNDAATVSGQKTYGFVFDSMDDAIQCSRQIVRDRNIDCTTSLYLDEEYFTYYLFMENNNTETTEFEKLVLSLNEFGDFFNEGPAAIAFIREHGKCIAKENAAQILAAL